MKNLVLPGLIAELGFNWIEWIVVKFRDGMNYSVNPSGQDFYHHLQIQKLCAARNVILHFYLEISSSYA